MTRALRFTKAELSRAVALVKADGVAVKLGRDGSILLFPANHISEALDRSEDDDLDAEWAAFEASHGEH